MGIWAGLGLEDREGKEREEGMGCVSQTNLFNEKCRREDEEEDRVKGNVAFCLSAE